MLLYKFRRIMYIWGIVKSFRGCKLLLKNQVTLNLLGFIMYQGSIFTVVWSSQRTRKSCMDDWDNSKSRPLDEWGFGQPCTKSFPKIVGLMVQYFPRKDHMPSFRVVNCWHFSFCEELHSWAIRREHDSTHQDVVFF